MKVKSKKHNNVYYEYFWVRGYTLKFWIGPQGFTLERKPENKTMLDWYISMLDNAFETLVRHGSKTIVSDAAASRLVQKIDWLEEAELAWFEHAVEQEARIQKLEQELALLILKPEKPKKSWWEPI
jgi:hypothetical protein